MSDKLAINDKLEPRNADQDEIRAVAMEIGKQVAFHIESMYPEAVRAASSTFLLSVRNCTHNAIMGLKEDKRGKTVKQWLAGQDKHRRTIRKLKKVVTVSEVEDIMRESQR